MILDLINQWLHRYTWEKKWNEEIWHLSKDALDHEFLSKVVKEVTAEELKADGK